MPDFANSRRKLKIAIGAMLAADVVAVAVLFSPLVGSADSRQLQLVQLQNAFAQLLEIFARHQPDLVTVHGRTVRDMYRTEVRYASIADAVRWLRCPVLANGNISSPTRAEEVLRVTGARGLMIGRGCIRNPWLFEQIRDHQAGRPVKLPTGRAVLEYIEALYEETTPDVDFHERSQVEKMKKYMNFVGEGISEAFLHQIRRVTTRADFFRVCREALDHDVPMPLAARRHEPLPEESQLAA